VRCRNLLVEHAVFVFVSFRDVITLLYVIYYFLFRMSLVIKIFYKNWLREKVVVCQLIVQTNLVKLMYPLSFQQWRSKERFLQDKEQKLRSKQR